MSKPTASLRIYQSDGTLTPISCVNVVGDDLHYWYSDAGSAEIPSFVASHKQALGEGTTERMRRLPSAVVVRWSYLVGQVGGLVKVYSAA